MKKIKILLVYINFFATCFGFVITEKGDFFFPALEKKHIVNLRKSCIYFLGIGMPR